MSQANESVRAGAGQESVGGPAVGAYDADDGLEWADLRSVVSWIRGHRVLAGAVVLIVAQLAWKAQFLHHLYFRQDDYHDLDLAIENPLSWKYLTFVGAGHLIIGLRIVAWFLARTALYNWGLASAVSLAFVAAASAAGYRALRTLFGDGPHILIPLALYLFSPLTVASLGWWSSAMESLPLQLATFMAVTAHVHYVRTRRRKHLVAAVLWLVFGLIFFEKALLLPPLLFALTAAFLVTERTLVAAVVRTARELARIWLIYCGVLAVYAVLLFAALRTSASTPQAPQSLAGVLQFVWTLLRETFFPGVLGGPWRWFEVYGGSYAFAAPATALSWLSLAVGITVVALSAMRRRVAWRSWAILAGWVFFADMFPVIIGRLNAFPPALLGLETRYLADAMPVLALCVGLAFWPVVGAGTAAAPARRAELGSADPGGSADEAAAPAPGLPDVVAAGPSLRNVVAALVGVVLVGSVASAQAYENVTTGAPPRTYIANAQQALKLAPPGTNVLDWPVPGDIVEGLFGRFALASTVVGDMERGKLTGKLHWVRNPAGTIDRLYVFGDDGRLYPVWVYPVASVHRTASQGCWPARHGRIAVTLAAPSSIYTGILRVGYIWGAAYPSYVTVRYGDQVRVLAVQPGFHQGFVPVSGGGISSVTFSGLSGARMCVGDVEVGNIRPYLLGTPIPKAVP